MQGKFKLYVIEKIICNSVCEKLYMVLSVDGTYSLDPRVSQKGKRNNITLDPYPLEWKPTFSLDFIEFLRDLLPYPQFTYTTFRVHSTA